MYVPSTHKDIIAIAQGIKYPQLRSVIFCTEDAIHASEVEAGIQAINTALTFYPVNHLLRFVRVRNLAVLKKLLVLPNIDRLTGVVLPKVSTHTITDYLAALNGTHLQIMPTLETLETFDQNQLIALRDMLCASPLCSQILMLRIGGNDLLNLLHMRRPKDKTAYQTILRALIEQIILIFRPYHFNLSSPVYEYISNISILEQEVDEDTAHGLFAKTVIHPSHIQRVEKHYKVSIEELEMAKSILQKNQAAIFKMHDSMCEVSTHTAWAKLTIHRANLYGITTHSQISMPQSSDITHSPTMMPLISI